MPRSVLLIIVTPLALCVGCASVGYFVLLPRLRTALSDAQLAVVDEIAREIAASVSDKIERRTPLTDRLVLVPADVDVNNAESLSGECGFSYSENETSIYGVKTEITPDGIALLCAVSYSAVPIVENGRIELTDVEVSNKIMGILLTKKGFEDGLELGINRALASYELTPTAITLADGSMTIQIAQTS